MILYIVGISCVGKSTIGKKLSEILGLSFYDIELEIEKYYNKSIERIQNECLTMYEYREKGSVVLDILFSKNENSVIAGPPSGLKYSYLQVYKKHKKNKDLVSIHIKDKAENILNRLTFYDIDSKPMTIILDESKKKRYLYSIKEDYEFFRESYNRADVEFDINGIPLEEIPSFISKKLIELSILPNGKNND